MNLILIPHFQHVGLALAISIGASFNAFMLFWALKQLKIYQVQKDLHNDLFGCFAIIGH